MRCLAKVRGAHRAHIMRIRQIRFKVSHCQAQMRQQNAVCRIVRIGLMKCLTVVVESENASARDMQHRRAA